MCAIPSLKETHFSIVPDGERRCVWMELGMVSYKICDRDFQCETCPLDIGLRGDRDLDVDSSAIPALARKEGVHPLRTALISRMVQPSRWSNRFFHSRHFWLQTLDQERIRVGFDLIAASMIGSIEQITLPQVGSRIQRERECGSFVKQGQSFTISSPVTGEVTAVNESLLSWPNRLSLDSMEEGWLFEVKAESFRSDMTHYKRGEKIWSWYVSEILKLDNRLAIQLPADSKTQIDEETLSEDLQNTISSEAYAKLILDLIGTVDPETLENDQG